MLRNKGDLNLSIKELLNISKEITMYRCISEDAMSYRTSTKTDIQKVKAADKRLLNLC